MLATSQKLLHRAKSLRRLHHSSKASATTDDVPAMPPTPTSPSFSLPLPPTTDRPRTHYGAQTQSHSHSQEELVLDAFHIRQASHASRASSSWSSTTSSTSSSHIKWDSLRQHPPMPTMRYDAGRSFYYEDAAFDFGFDGEHESADIHPASSADEDVPVLQGLSPPPRHHKLRAQQSPVEKTEVTVTPRVQSADSESERYFKRGDWKRRGIVFGYDHVV